MAFENYSAEVKAVLEQTAIAFLHEAGGEMAAQYQKNTRVDTGKTAGGISYQVDETALEAVIGGDSMNHIWEEFGTGEYALGGDGRKNGWVYKDSLTGKMRFTRGKRPSRAFRKAYDMLKDPIIREAQTRFGGL